MIVNCQATNDTQKGSKKKFQEVLAGSLEDIVVCSRNGTVEKTRVWWVLKAKIEML